MYKFLLINNNMAVSKLIGASFKKLNYAFVEISNYSDLPLKPYVAVIIDSNLYNENYIDDLKSLSIIPNLIFLKKQNDEIPKHFSTFINKPFLPTDFIALLSTLLEENINVLHYIEPYMQEKDSQTNCIDQNNNCILNKNDIDEIKQIIEDDIFENHQHARSIFEEIESNKVNEIEKKNEDMKKDLFQNTSLDNLNENELIQALEEENMLPKPISIEIVKGELKNAIEQSIAITMQSQVLKETLKGLKMNITITFEDK